MRSVIQKYLFIVLAEVAIGILPTNAGLFFGIEGWSGDPFDWSKVSAQTSSSLLLNDDFSANPLTNTGVYTSITSPTNLTVTHLAGTDQIRVTLNAGAPGANFGLAAQFSRLSGSSRSNFTVSTSFTSTGSVYLATWLTALCTNANYTTGYAAGFQAQTNQLYIYKGSSAVSNITWNGKQQGDFTMSLKGFYVLTGLELTLTLNDGTTSQSLSWTDTGTLSTNRHFGVAARVADTNGSVTLNGFDVAAQKRAKLLLSDERIQSIKQTAATNALMAQVLAKIASQANSYYYGVALTYPANDSAMQSQAWDLVARTLSLGFQYRLTGNTNYAAEAKSNLLVIASYPDWYYDGFSGALGSSEMGFAAAIGYDWLYEVMSVAERAQVRASMVSKILTNAPLAYASASQIPTNRLWYAFDSSWQAIGNWAPACDAGYLTIAMALRDEEPALAKISIKGAIESLKIVQAECAKHPAWPEGSQYLNYMLNYHAVIAAMLDGICSNTFGVNLDLCPVVDFMAQIFGPTGEAFNYADCGPTYINYSSTGYGGYLTWLEKNCSDPAVINTLNNRLTNTVGLVVPQRFFMFFPLSAIWFPEQSSDPSAAMPLDAQFDGDAALVLFRSHANDTNALWIGAKGGSNSWSHGHLDLGAFVLESDGQRWGVDLGLDNYNADYWDYSNGGTRWNYFRCSSLGHSTVCIGTNLQDATAQAGIVGYQSTVSNAFATVDLSDVYFGKALKLQRGVAMLDRARVLIQDEVTGSPIGTPLDWRMMTKATGITISTNGRTATLTQNGKTMRADILSPITNTVVFSVQPVPPPGAGESTNTGVSILNIHYSIPKTNQTLTVLMTPVGARWPVLTNPTNGAINTWNFAP